MRFSFKLCCVFTALLISGASPLPCRAQASFPPCRPDGSMPDGLEQCECTKPPLIYRGEYRDPEGRYQIPLPDGVVATAPSRAPVGSGFFQISLAHPSSAQPHPGENDGELPWNRFWFDRSGQTNLGLKEMADRWAQNRREESRRDHSTDLQIDPPVPTSLSSLPAIRLKATRNELDHGKVIYEVMVAKDQDEYVYVGMVSSADHYEKSRELFQSVVEGFRYMPPNAPAGR